MLRVRTKLYLNILLPILYTQYSKILNLCKLRTRSAFPVYLSDTQCEISSWHESMAGKIKELTQQIFCEKPYNICDGSPVTDDQ